MRRSNKERKSINRNKPGDTIIHKTGKTGPNDNGYILDAKENDELKSFLKDINSNHKDGCLE